MSARPVGRRRLNWGAFAPYMLTALILAAETVWVAFHWRAGHQWRGLAVAYNGAISGVFAVAAVAALLKGKPESIVDQTAPGGTTNTPRSGE